MDLPAGLDPPAEHSADAGSGRRSPAPRRIVKTRIYAQVVMHLQQEILSGHRPPGSKLPTERELAAQFAVSRASVREALSVLQSRGLIESRQGGGTIVSRRPDLALMAPLAERLGSSRAAIMNPLEVRAIFEPQTAALAAERASEIEVAMMAQCVRAQEETVADGGTGIEEDTAFHFAIARASHNDLIVTIVSQINHALREGREWSLRARTGAANSIRHHHNILNAIAMHDPAAARLAMTAHLEDVQMLAFRWLQERAGLAPAAAVSEAGRSPAEDAADLWASLRLAPPAYDPGRDPD